MRTPKGLCCLLLGLLFSVVSLAAGSNSRLSFGGLDLSSDNRMLFRSDRGAQHAVFVSRLTDLALRQLTAYPEQMELIENNRMLLVWNGFGAFRIPSEGGLPQLVAGFPSVAAGTVSPGGRSTPLAASVDGRWILYMENTGPAYGKLLLLEVNSGKRRLVSDKVELPGRYFPASWSPDSRLFIYAKGGRLYYYPIGNTVSEPAAERFREIGEGGINSICWGGAGSFFYFKGNTLFHVRSAGLHIRTIYGNFLPVGAAAGRFPMEFEPQFDRFWMAPDSRSILFAKAGRSVFFYPLNTGNTGESAPSPYPHVMIPGGALDINVLWPRSGAVTITAQALAGNAIFAWRFTPPTGPVKAGGGASPENGEKAAAFIPLEAPPSSRCALSPNGTRALFWGEKGIFVRNYGTWQPLLTLVREGVASCAWLNNGEFIAGDAQRIERINLSGQRRLVCISGAGEYGFEEGENGRILASSGGEWFACDGMNPWAPASGAWPRPASLSSGRYRVFLERRAAGPYENIPMIRSITSEGSASLLPVVAQSGPLVQEERRAPATTGGTVDGVFVHGRRDGKRRVALCFDLYDDDTGLPQALNALSRFNASATFFLNGAFIRNNPEAAAAISRAGHEAASLFYAPIDLTDPRYIISPEFIAQGLARNEDDYNDASGAELSLLWHAPFYRAQADISAAASKAAYLTVGRDVDPLDWVTRDEARRQAVPQRSAPEMVEQIMADKQAGSIIPIRLGLLPGGRDDYLFLYIEALLDALDKAGYEVTTVSALKEQ